MKKSFTERERHAPSFLTLVAVIPFSLSLSQLLKQSNYGHVYMQLTTCTACPPTHDTDHSSLAG